MRVQSHKTNTREREDREREKGDLKTGRLEVSVHRWYDLTHNYQDTTSK